MGIISKSIKNYLNPTTVSKASRGTMSSYTMGVSPSYGQPFPEVVAGDASGLITRERMREIVMKTPTAAACLNAVLDYASGVDIAARNKDASLKIGKQKENVIKDYLSSPNPQQSGRQFELTLLRDLWTFGYAAVEIDKSPGHRPYLWVLDNARLRIDYDEHGTVNGYDMLNARGLPISKSGGTSHNYQLPTGMNMGVTDYEGDGEHGWLPQEIIFFSRNPISSSVYPTSQLTQLFTCAVIEDMMLNFIGGRFTDSNVPFGIMDLGDVTEQELKIAINNWNAQAREQHRILLTGSKGGSKWVPFGYHLKDLEATGLLAEVRGKIMAICGVTMNELGESQDVGKSSGYNLSFTFKKRAIEPVLDEYVDTLTRRLIWDELGYTDTELYYEPIDSRDEQVQAQIDIEYLKMGVVTINDIRNRRGAPDIPGGEVNYVFTGSSWVPVELLQEFAQVLINVEQSATLGNISGDESSNNAKLKPAQGDTQSAPKRPEGNVHSIRNTTGEKR